MFSFKFLSDVLDGKYDGVYNPHTRREEPNVPVNPMSFHGNSSIFESFDYDMDEAFRIHTEMVKSAASESANAYSKDSSNINFSLWDHHQKGILPERWIHHIKNLDDEFNSNKSIGDFHVYHGLRHSPSMFGSHIYLPSYSSTSTDPMHANEFAAFTKHKKDNFEYEHSAGARHILKIKIHPKASAMSMMDISNHPYEQEVLLGRGAVLKLGNKTKAMDNTYLWDAELLGHIRKPMGN